MGIKSEKWMTCGRGFWVAGRDHDKIKMAKLRRRRRADVFNMVKNGLLLSFCDDSSHWLRGRGRELPMHVLRPGLYAEFPWLGGIVKSCCTSERPHLSCSCMMLPNGGKWS